MSVQGVIATVSTPAVIILSQLLTIARSGISRLAVWDVDRLKYIRFQRIGGACVRIAHESSPWSITRRGSPETSVCEKRRAVIRLSML